MRRVEVSFDAWVQLLGMLGVIGSLVFVGLEMRQSQRIALVSQFSRGLMRLLLRLMHLLKPI